MISSEWKSADSPLAVASMKLKNKTATTIKEAATVFGFNAFTIDLIIKAVKELSVKYPRYKKAAQKGGYEFIHYVYFGIGPISMVI